VGWWWHCRYSAVCAILANDFAGYMDDPQALRLDVVVGEPWGPDARPQQARGAVHACLPGVAWNHEGEPVAEKPEQWLGQVCGRSPLLWC
jgi:hypothetical protein